MPYDGYEPIRIEKFGGLNTLVDPTNLPIFASPDCQDVEFIYGLVRTRPGITSQFPPLVSNPTVNYLKTYITNALAIRMLALDSLGVLWKENPQGTLASAGTIENAGVYANSVSQFGREYLAIGDGKFGTSIPRQFDDTNFDRVSQVGPGAPPNVTDEVTALIPIAASPTGLTLITSGTLSFTEAGNVVTATFAGGANIVPAGSQVGDSIQVFGAGSYNGTFQISAILSSTQLQYICAITGLPLVNTGGVIFQMVQVTTSSAMPFVAGQVVAITGATLSTYNLTYSYRGTVSGTVGNIYSSSVPFGTAASGGGNIQGGGNVVAGTHKVAVLFVTRQGAFTAPSPTGSWISAGNKRAIVANIPIGPSNVVQRILLFTASGGSSFFYQTSTAGLISGNFIVNDNTTTSVTLDFSDTTLLSGTNADLLFRQIELGECSGVFSSPSGTRLLWTGERKKDTNGGNFVNLTFDGGFALGAAVGGGDLPLGWTGDPSSTFSTGGTVAPVGTAIWGNAYRISGDGVTAVKGRIFQSAYQDYLGNPIFQPATAYSIRVRLLNQPGSLPFTQGNVQFQIFSASGGISSNFTVAASSLTNSYKEFIGQITAALTVIPSDLVFRVYMDGTPTSAAAAIMDNIEFFPTSQPYNATIVRVSKASQPEVYDGVDGFLDIAPSNGQATRTGFVIRNNIYLVKERSLYVTQDDGENEAALWSIQEVSAKVGTLSVRGVGLGDEWAIIAGQSGVYYFDGSEPQKLSQEIQPTWDAINWAFGHLIDVKVDTKRKRVYIDVPFGASTVNNRKLTLDYTDGFGDPNPTNTVNIAGIGRKWVPWTGNIVGNSQNFILRADGTQPLFIGNSAGNGKIYGLDLGILINGIIQNTVFTDDGVKINDYWQSGYAQDIGRLDFGYLTANVVGSGSLGIVLRKGDQGWLGNVRSWFMQSTGFRDLERQINLTTERLAMRFGSVGVGDHFSMQGISAYARPSVSAPHRGVNV